MSWRHLLCVPLAAWLVGESAAVRPAREKIPAAAGTCSQQAAKEKYLRAFAYRVEDPRASRELCRAARDLSSGCADPILKLRISGICE